MLSELAQRLHSALIERNMSLCTAESCTGGLVASLITQQAGASDIFERGFITYSNNAKVECLGVKRETLKEYGAVSAQTASAMASGAIKNSRADIALSITGIAGPDGGTPEKPVGLVHFAIATEKDVQCFDHIFSGNRIRVQMQAAELSFQKLLEYIEATH